MRLLEHSRLDGPIDPAELLLAVVAPSPKLLRASLAAVREEKAA
jgi:hypothetical protein